VHEGGYCAAPLQPSREVTVVTWTPRACLLGSAQVRARAAVPVSQCDLLPVLSCQHP